MNIPLRKTGPLLSPLKVIQEEAPPPRALRSLAQIIENDLCHRCGSCIGICPTSVLGTNEDGYPEVKRLSSCTDCDLCVNVCPGDEFSVPSMAQELFGFVPDVKDMHGHIEEAFVSYAEDTEIRQGSTSGGTISGLLLSMLERGVIDGAITISSDPEIPWKGKPIIATNRAEILSTMKSKYAICPTNVMLETVAQTEGRYALVGLPCQIHGFLKAAALNRKIKERVVLTIGLFCHAAVEHDPMKFIWSTLGEDKDRVKRFISRVGKHPGTPYVELDDGTLKPVYFPEAKHYRPSSLEILNILYRLYTPKRCLTCYDSTSEFADIAVGDPWMTPPDDTVDFQQGYSFVLARTERGLSALRESEDAQALRLVTISKEHARSSNTMMGHEKRGRAFRIIETRRRQGLAIPEYGFPPPRLTGKELFHTELNMLSHFFCFVSWGRLTLLKLGLSKLGYAILWANFQRRKLREWRRDRRFKKQQAKAATQAATSTREAP